MLANFSPRTLGLASGVVAAALLAGCGDNDITVALESTRVELTQLGTFSTGQFDESAAEIVAYDATTQRAYVVNAQAASIDILDISDPAQPAKLGEIDASTEGDNANSVAVSNGTIAVAIEVVDATDDSQQLAGKVVFYTAADAAAPVKIGEATAGFLPDMLTFTPDGQTVLVANEGEPNDDYTVDPEGSITLIDVSGGFTNPTTTQISFNSFDSQAESLRAEGVRIFGPGASVSEDLEPEYIAVSADSATAWVVLQENNALAVVDIATATVTDILPLGFKDFRTNALDPSNRDSDSNGGINIATRSEPLFGMYQPDAIAAMEFEGATYLLTANEGDARDYDGFSEEYRAGDSEIVLDTTAFPNAATTQTDAELGRIRITSTLGIDEDTAGCDPASNGGDPTGCTFSELYAYGARSFSVWSADGTLVFDSGDDFESLTASLIPEGFNASNDENDADARSDDKGPEPEAITLGQIGSQTYAFIGLERVGGIMVYNVTDPTAPVYVTYLNNRDFSATQAEVEAGTAGDLGPEGIAFVSAADSPTGTALLIVGSEVSGTTTVYAVTPVQ